MKTSKIFILCFLSLGLLFANAPFQTANVQAEEFELESIMEDQMENIQEGVRQDIKTSIKQESYEVAAENIIEPSVAETGTHACQSVTGIWHLDAQETYCDGQFYAALQTVTIDSACTLTLVSGPGGVPKVGTVSGNTITWNYSFTDAFCNGGATVVMSGSGTLSGSTATGNFSYSTTGSGSFTATKQ